MTSVVAGAATVPRAGLPVVAVLARMEARRLVLHPATIVGWGLLTFMFAVNVAEADPISAFDEVSTGPTFYPGLFCVLAAHMVTTRDLRAGTEEALCSVPATRAQRVLALLLAALVPALIALVLNVLSRSYFVWQEVYVEAPGVGHVLQGPVTVLGGCLLGIMLGSWLPQRGTPVLAMVVLVAGSIALGSGSHRMALFTPLVSWVDWGPYDGTAWYALEAGSPAAHVVYLLGLSGLAGVAAWIRVGVHRVPALLLATGLLALAVWGGMAQLP
jgi:hypothetical protein